MKPEEIQKLLGGYATGTLTPEEQQALFQAALDDQELFDALAREQSLRDLLRDPAARAHVLAAVEERPRRWWQRGSRWVWIGGLAAACLAVVVGIYSVQDRRVASRVLVAETKPEPEPPMTGQMSKPQTPAKGDRSTPKATPAPRAAARRAAPAPSGGGGRTSDAALEKSATAAPPEAKSPVHSEPAAVPRAAAPQAESLPAAAPPPAPAPATPPSAPRPMADTVAVTSAAPMIATNGSVGGALAPQNARALFYAGAQTAVVPRQSGSGGAQFQLQQPKTLGTLAVPNLGVKWSALRKQPDGLFSEVDSDQLKAGDVIKLRLVPNADGYLSVREGGRPLVSDSPATRLQPFETPEITSGTGTRELIVLLAQQAQAGRTQEAIAQEARAQKAKQPQPAALFRTAAADQLSQSDRSEHAVYEVRTGKNLFAPVLVRITLNFQ